MLTRQWSAACAVLVCAGANVQAQYPRWIADDGDWHDPANWDGGVVPGAGPAIVNNGGTARIGSQIVQSSIAIGHGGAPDLFGAGDGRVVQTGGVLGQGLSSNLLFVGERGGVRGEYELVGPGMIDAPEGFIRLGNEGVARFLMRAGAQARVGVVDACPRIGMETLPTAVAEIDIEGTGTVLRVFGAPVQPLHALELGLWGSTSMTIHDGAVVEARACVMASSTPAGSRYAITGSGAALRLGGSEDSVLLIGRSSSLDDDAEPGAATLTLADGARIESVAPGDPFGIIVAPRGVLRGYGMLEADELTLLAGGRLEPGPVGGLYGYDTHLDLTGASAGNGLDGVVAIEIPTAGYYGPLTVRDAKLGGTLEVSFAPGYEPARGDSFQVVSYTHVPSLTRSADLRGPGRFRAVSAPVPTDPDLYVRAYYGVDGVQVRVVGAADFDADTFCDLSDIPLFIDLFLEAVQSGSANEADLTRDGVVNFDDIQRFVDAYLGGCE